MILQLLILALVHQALGDGVEENMMKVKDCVDGKVTDGGEVSVCFPPAKEGYQTMKTCLLGKKAEMGTATDCGSEEATAEVDRIMEEVWEKHSKFLFNWRNKKCWKAIGKCWKKLPAPVKAAMKTEMTGFIEKACKCEFDKEKMQSAIDQCLQENEFSEDLQKGFSDFMKMAWKMMGKACDGSWKKFFSTDSSSSSKSSSSSAEGKGHSSSSSSSKSSSAEEATGGGEEPAAGGEESQGGGGGEAPTGGGGEAPTGGGGEAPTGGGGEAPAGGGDAAE